MKKLKILHTVEFYYPSIGGAQEVVRHLSERMVKAGHDVTVATTKLPERDFTIFKGVKIAEFDVSGNRVNGIKGADVQKYKDFLKKNKFDVVMNYAAQQWTVDLFFDVIDDVKAKKVFVPCGYSALYDPNYRSYFENLPKLLKKYDATVYLAEKYRDIDFARQHKLKNIFVIPNGADEKEFTKPISEQRRKFLTNKYGIGGFTIMTIGLYGEKGHLDTLRVFKRLPITKGTFISVGHTRPDEGNYNTFNEAAYSVNTRRKFLNKRVVLVDGNDREDIRDLLKMTDVFVFLSNIECSPLVLFESAAAGVPFLATSAGNSEEIARWTGAGTIVKSHPSQNSRVIADQKDTLIKLTRLAHSSKLRHKLGSTGRKSWEEKYTWERLSKEYISLYESLVEDDR